MKFLFVLAAALLMTVAVPTQSGETGASARAFVRGLDNCSSVIIAPGIALTADHCVAADAVSIGGVKPTVLARGDDSGKNEDFALIAFPQSGFACPCVTLASRDADLDETVYVIGFPGMIAQVVTVGASQGVHESERTPGRRLVTTAPAVGGNSGGGVFVLRDGQYQLVGLLAEGFAHISFAVPVSDLRKFIERSLPRVQGI